jgi:hypothetical protein
MAMKNYILFLAFSLLLLSFSCQKKENEIKEIKVDGTAYDLNNNKLDSVKVTLKEFCFMCSTDIPISSVLTDSSGFFTFVVVKKEGQSYFAEFEKTGFLTVHKSIEGNIAYQNFIVKMAVDTLYY